MHNAISFSRWRIYRAWMRGFVPAAQRDWLLERGSLTERLLGLCDPACFRVHVCSERAAIAGLDEAAALGVRDGLRLKVREVQLRCDGEAWVYAHTLIPVTTFRGRLQRLNFQGGRSLGATLFADPTLRRGPVQIRRTDAGEIPGAGGAPVWGRRTLFRAAGLPLLVSEYFLPALFERAPRRHLTP